MYAQASSWILRAHAHTYTRPFYRDRVYARTKALFRGREREAALPRSSAVCVCVYVGDEVAVARNFVYERVNCL